MSAVAAGRSRSRAPTGAGAGRSRRRSMCALRINAGSRGSYGPCRAGNALDTLGALGPGGAQESGRSGRPGRTRQARRSRTARRPGGTHWPLRSHRPGGPGGPRHRAVLWAAGLAAAALRHLVGPVDIHRVNKLLSLGLCGPGSPVRRRAEHMARHFMLCAAFRRGENLPFSSRRRFFARRNRLLPPNVL